MFVEGLPAAFGGLRYAASLTKAVLAIYSVRLPSRDFGNIDAMNSQLIEEALKTVPSQQALVNIVSKRVRQLNQGDRPMVDASFRAGFADIALQEIIEGKLVVEYPPDDIAATH